MHVARWMRLDMKQFAQGRPVPHPCKVGAGLTFDTGTFLRMLMRNMHVTIWVSTCQKIAMRMLILLGCLLTVTITITIPIPSLLAGIAIGVVVAAIP